MIENGAASASVGASGLKGIVAGALTGIIEISVTYPTEYIKTQLQLDEKSSQGTVGKKYAGIVDCARQTVKDHGFLGLYRGMTVLLVGTVPKSAIRFGAFEGLRSWMSNGVEDLSVPKRALCGLGAGVTEAIFAVTPMETIKVKFINDQRTPNPRFKGFIHGVKLILKEEGIRGLYQGVLPTVLRQGTNQGVRFFVMETCKDAYKQGDSTKKIPKLVVGGFGALAGAASVFANTPIDVVKTRLQGLDAHRYRGTLDCFLQVWKNEGPSAFYKGTVPRLTRVCLDVALTFMIYDSITEIFNKIWP